MLMHFTNNTLVLVLSKIPSLKDAETFADVMSPWAYAGVIAACIIFLAAAFITLRAIPMRSEDAVCNCDEVPAISAE